MQILKVLGALYVTAWLLAAPMAYAQDSTDAESRAIAPLSPTLTLSALDARIKSLDANTDLDEMARRATLDQLKLAKEQLTLAGESRQTANRLAAQAQTASVDVETLEVELQEVLTQLAKPVEGSDAPMTNDSLFEMEQEVRSLDSRAETIRGQIRNLDNSVSTLAARTTAARNELASAKKIRDEISAQIAASASDEASPQTDARKSALFARRYAREWQIEALELEIANIPQQERLLVPRRDLASAQLRLLTRRIEVLRSKTGEQRLAEAQGRLRQAQAFVDQVSDLHPLAQSYAAENLEYATQIFNIAQAGGNSSVVEARVNSRLKQLSEDKALAEQILAEGDIDRKYGAVLRRLRADIPNETNVKRDISDRTKTKLDLSMQRILAQDRLKELPLADFSLEPITERWTNENPDALPLTQADTEALRTALSSRRELLLEISSNASRKVEKLVQLNTAQQSLIVEIEDLSNLLDQQLIWLPSTEPISLSWPREVLGGFATTFAPRNLSASVTSFLQSLRAHWLLTFMALIILGAAVALRPRFEDQVEASRKTIGKVREDTLWSTPLAVLGGVVRALPIVMATIWVGYLLVQSQYRGVGQDFSQRLGLALITIAMIWGVLLTLRRWNRDGHLFDLHFKVKAPLRNRIRNNMMWFGAAQTVSVLLMTLCEDFATNSEAAGLGLFGFLVGSTSIGVLTYRLLGRTPENGRLLKAGSFMERHRKGVLTLILAIPAGTILLALSGYFATAIEVQTRLIITSGLILAAYIVYGVVRRTVEVSERRLALQTALERRAQAVAEREDREAAEERGEMLVPTVNYEEIDLESISRQSTQLLNIVCVIVFGALAWLLWADLLPALSIFDRVKLPFNTSYLDSDNIRQMTPATVWDLIQAIFVGALAFFGAKNLPGFLDLFILKRAGMTAGTRYAITTVLGYIIVLIGIVLVSDKLGIEWGNLQWIIAALGVGIGFGLQEIIANFISGLIILFERPVRLGDYVTIGDQSGTVHRIQIRATTLSDLDHREILIPNKELITGRVTNWTLSNSTLRMIVKVGIAYGSDTDAAQKIMLRTVKKVKSVLTTPEPQVLFLGFGDSSLDFEIRVFLPTVTSRFPVAHEIHTEVNKALDKAGISIPYPQRDLHIITPPPEAFPEPEKAKSVSAKKPTLKSSPKPTAIGKSKTTAKGSKTR